MRVWFEEDLLREGWVKLENVTAFLYKYTTCQQDISNNLYRFHFSYNYTGKHLTLYCCSFEIQVRQNETIVIVQNINQQVAYHQNKRNRLG